MPQGDLVAMMRAAEAKAPGDDMASSRAIARWLKQRVDRDPALLIANLARLAHRATLADRGGLQAAALNSRHLDRMRSQLAALLELSC
ncbi:MAG: hypothetical protein E6J14_08170 [Chloroflexi bacterium]|nr:MAG: hypothetical protein E6J14_08170 [Chloroflexota bacterium]